MLGLVTFERTPSLPPLDVPRRAERVRARLADASIDALLVTDLTNVRWLSGFTGSAGRALLLPDGMVLVVDGRYGDQAAAQVADHGVEATVLVGRTQAELVALVASSVSSVARLGLEAEHISWAERDRLAGALAPELVATIRLVEAERRSKDDGELARLAHAAAIASEALADVFSMLDDGPTEREFALGLDDRMRALGAEGPSFATIVAAGPNAALPHHQPDDRRIRPGDALDLRFRRAVRGLSLGHDPHGAARRRGPVVAGGIRRGRGGAGGRGRGRAGRTDGGGSRPGVPRLAHRGRDG